MSFPEDGRDHCSVAGHWPVFPFFPAVRQAMKGQKQIGAAAELGVMHPPSPGQPPASEDPAIMNWTIRKFFESKRDRQGAFLPATAAGERIYAIGDVHGCYRALRKLLKQIREHSEALPRPKSLRVILLGDLIDRGPDSQEILNFLARIQGRTTRLVVLKGNHEDMMLRVIDREITTQGLWLRAGGLATLESFGVEPLGRGRASWALAERLRDALGPDLIDWLRHLPVSAQSGDYLFVHAGIRPGLKLNRQKTSDLLWIRDEFLEDESDHGHVVVHGHSVHHRVDERANRIGIDTGAYRTGRLSALYLEGTKREILTTDPE